MASRKNLSCLENPKPCPHLSSYRERYGISGYESLQKCIGSSLNRLRLTNRGCISCPAAAFSRLYACLICSAISCPSHAASHSRSSLGHDISVDVDRAELFCLLCADQVYDPGFDSIVVAAAAEILRPFPIHRKRKRKLPMAIPLPPLGLRKPLGLRGLNNLGNTCFMNSILQALLHAPPLMNYFLGDCHRRRRSCRNRRRGSVEEGPCLGCLVEAVFSEVFSGERKPYSPAMFLYSWWRHSSNLSGYEQQDAHEFFISMLDWIHDKEQLSGSNINGIVDCHCIAHCVFSGILRSDVTCTLCGFTSTTYDPCVDISLDLETVHGASSTLPGKPANTCENFGMSTLAGSLGLFTRPEKLGSDQKLLCQSCGVERDSVKQMSIRKLPLVLCFHVKRFSHSAVWMESKKLDEYMQFPFSLDMMPYLSSSVIRSRLGNRIFVFDEDESNPSGEMLSSKYEVFAVVTHSGRLESGHYVTYLRLKYQWYKCDDAWITEVGEELARALQVYMIYYVQKDLYYKAGEER